jgi:gamma-glutamyl:cysteine ligase YbdK (ATP-grasp superfamily)
MEFVTTAPLHLFDAFGIELEYMIVDAATLDVRPIADELFRAVAGEYVSDVVRGPTTWSNELVAHVVELKTTTPVRSLGGLAEQFQQEVRAINELLAPMGAQLLGTAMHPWMDPLRETKLWPHDNSEIYDAFNRVFDCRGHGWANLQSMHINLPFSGDEEFARLHAAVRLLLPLLPALAASSPVMDGKLTGLMDSRLEVYRKNSQRIPQVAGRVIPERAFSRAEYDRLIFDPLYAAIAPHDPAGILQEEFLNARGAIARFDRGSIEMRVIDVQECPAADVAIAQLAIAVLQMLVSERWSRLEPQQRMEIDPLERVLLGTIRDAERAVIDDAVYLSLLGITNRASLTVGEVWQQLAADAEKTGLIDASIAAVALGHRGPVCDLLVERADSRSCL